MKKIKEKGPVLMTDEEFFQTLIKELKSLSEENILG